MSDFDMYRLFKTLHVLAVVLLGSSIVMESVLGPMMARATSVQELRVYTRILGVVDKVFFPLSALLLVGFGYAAAGRLDIDLGTTWLLLGQILFYVAAVIGFVFLGRAGRRLHRTVELAPDGELTDEIRRQLANPLPPILGMVTAVLFVTIVYLMVAKPDW